MPPLCPVDGVTPLRVRGTTGLGEVSPRTGASLHSGGAKRAVPRGCRADSAIPKAVSGHAGMAHSAALGSALPQCWHVAAAPSVPCADEGCSPFVGSHGHPLPHCIAWRWVSTWGAVGAQHHGLSTQRFGSVARGGQTPQCVWRRWSCTGMGQRPWWQSSLVPSSPCHHPRATCSGAKDRIPAAMRCPGGQEGPSTVPMGAAEPRAAPTCASPRC